MSRRFFFVLPLLTLALVACAWQINIPSTQTPSALVTESINVPLPADTTQPTNLKLAFGAGTLKLSPGAPHLVDGTAVYNLPDFKPEISTNGNNVGIEQGNFHLTGIPDLTNIRNEWDLQLGAAPLDLKIEAGGYTGDFSLGGLALVNLSVEEGASKVDLSFDQPNLTEMNLLRYQTGASNVSITGLANANFASMQFSSGAGNYTLDFSGELKRDASVTIETGLSNLTLVIPEGVPVQLTVEGGLSNVNQGSGWTQNGSVYTQPGSGPQLIILVKMGAGNLNLTQ